MRVLGVITDTDRRGGQVFGVQLADRLIALGADVQTVALVPGADGGLPVHVVGDSRWSWSATRRLRDLMAGVDVTLAHGSSTLPACALATLGRRRPFVYRQISDPLYWAGGGSRRWRVRQYYRAPSHVVALSTRTGSVLEQHFGVDRDRMTIIPNAVDERRFPPTTDELRVRARRRMDLPDDRHVVACVGSLSVEKGVGDLIDAADPSWCVLLAGGGAHREEFEAAARGRGLDVRFLGSVEDTSVVYQAADVVVLASRSEQQPATVIEASLSGVAVVATDVGDVDEMVDDGVTGLLVDPCQPDQLRAAITRLLATEDLRHRMGRAARESMLGRFTLDAVAPRWFDVLERTVEAQEPAA